MMASASPLREVRVWAILKKLDYPRNLEHKVSTETVYYVVWAELDIFDQ